MSLALFDFDGTITTHETMPDFIRRSVSRDRLLIGQLFLAPLVVGYKLGLVSGTIVRRAIVRFGYSGVSLAKIEAVGNEFARTYLQDVMRKEALERINWHKEQGHKIVVVSGGLDLYLRPWCEEHGFELICSSLEHDRGVLTGRYAGQQCVLKEKARRVLERYDLTKFPAVYAYGDTREDMDMLAIATYPVYRWKDFNEVSGR